MLQTKFRFGLSIKSTMKLVDDAEFKKLLSSLKIEETISGGSIANSIVGLSQTVQPFIQDNIDINASIKPAFNSGFPFSSLIETPFDSR